jgi:hypothetical protein
VSWLKNDMNFEIGGNKASLIENNKYEYVKGFKFALVTPVMFELVNGGKREKISLLETKFVLGMLVECNLVNRNAFTLAATFEYDHGERNKLCPSGDNQTSQFHQEKADELKELIAAYEEKSASNKERIGRLKERLTTLQEKVGKLNHDVKDFKRFVGAYSGEFGNVKWQSDSGWAESISGNYTIEANELTIKAKGDALAKGSDLTFLGATGKIILAGGEVKVNKNLKIA